MRRALLNFGHTFGHALEAETGFGDRLLHGEAVALGMVLAFDFAVRLGIWLRDRMRHRVRRHIAANWPADRTSPRSAWRAARRRPAARPYGQGQKGARRTHHTDPALHRIGDASKCVMRDASAEDLRTFLSKAA